MVDFLFDHAYFGEVAFAERLAEVSPEGFEYQSFVVAYHEAQVFEKPASEGDVARLAGGEELPLSGDDLAERGVERPLLGFAVIVWFFLK